MFCRAPRDVDSKREPPANIPLKQVIGSAQDLEGCEFSNTNIPLMKKMTYRWALWLNVSDNH